MSKKTIRYAGFLGFLGFTGFEYFATGDLINLSGFAFFAFFAYFWIAKLSVSVPDERFSGNTKLAKAFVGDIAVIELAILFVVSMFLSHYPAVLVFGITVAFASLVIAYAVKLYYLEEQ